MPVRSASAALPAPPPPPSLSDRAMAGNVLRAVPRAKQPTNCVVCGTEIMEELGRHRRYCSPRCWKIDYARRRAAEGNPIRRRPGATSTAA
jgi:endogenous inhibitor of DNA gyrase (YacG/DUF329 family)